MLYGEIFGRVQDLTYGAGDGEVWFRAFDVLRYKFLDAREFIMEPGIRTVRWLRWCHIAQMEWKSWHFAIARSGRRSQRVSSSSLPWSVGTCALAESHSSWWNAYLSK